MDSNRRLGITGLESAWQTVGKSLRMSSTFNPVTTMTRSRAVGFDGQVDVASLRSQQLAQQHAGVSVILNY